MRDADAGSLLRAHAHTPASLVGRIYFTGYTLCTWMCVVAERMRPAPVALERARARSAA